MGKKEGFNANDQYLNNKSAMRAAIQIQFSTKTVRDA